MDAAQLAKAFLAGAKSLESQQEYINELMFRYRMVIPNKHDNDNYVAAREVGN